MLGKRLINSNSAASGATCTTDTLQILGDTSCIAYYKMSDATDESGSYDGTPTSVNFNVAGKFGNAGVFNGSSGYVSLPTSVITQDNFTISLWINPDTNYTASNFVPYVFAHQASSGNRGVTFGYNGYSPAGWIFNCQNGAASSGVSISAPPINTWTHIAATYSTSNGLNVYVNGISQGTDTYAALDLSNHSGCNLGTRGYSVGDYFDGKIDQVRIFNKALTSTEVTTLNDEVYCVPTIVPTDNFEPVIYTGNGSTQSITSLNFKPDLTWIKSRSDAYGHILNDSVRGANKFLYSNTTEAEDVRTNSDFSSFDTNGFTLGTNYVALNGSSSQTYVAWNWKAGGADVLNQEGTIDSQVSANVDAGFSVVKHNKPVSTSGTVGHGLNTTPQLIIAKSLDVAENWSVNTSIIDGSWDYAYLNFTDQFNNSSLTPPTSTIFNVVGGSSTSEYINYCFHSVDGYSKIGSTVGTGASNFIYTGFRPAFVMFKEASTAGSWFMIDNKRGTDKRLLANAADAEGAITQVSFSSNGFEVSGGFSSSSTTYIFMAFAEEVFVPDNFFNDDSTVATYKLDGDAGDDSGNGNNGTASNVTYAAGKFDKAAVFNGSSSYIDLGSTIDNPLRTASAFGTSFWFNANSYGSDSVILKLLNDIYIFIYLNASNQLECRVSNSSGVQSIITTAVSLNTWYHVVWTGDSTNGVTLYLNGSSIGNTSWNGTFYTYTNTNYKFNYLGYNGDNAGWYNGSIDQVRIFDRALDSGEVTQLYNE